MASRFQALDSDESFENSESESEENKQRRNAEDRRQWFEDSSEEEDETRVVKTQKDKRWEILTSHCTKIKNKLKIQDYVSAFTEYEELNRQIVKSESVIQVEGIPVFYIRTLVRLEDAVVNLTKEAQKKLSTNTAKSFTKLKLNLKKNNKAYEEQILKFRANPVDSEESSEYEEEEEKKPEKKPEKKTKKVVTKESDDDDDDENDDENEDDSDEE